MFPRCMTLLEARMSCRLVSSSMFQCYFEDVMVLGECCLSGRDSVNLPVLVFVYGVVSLSQIDVPFNVLNLNVVDIHWIGSSSPLSSTFHLQMLIFTFIS